MKRRTLTTIFLIVAPLAILIEGWVWGISLDQQFDRIYYFVFGMIIWRVIVRLSVKHFGSGEGVTK